MRSTRTMMAVAALLTLSACNAKVEVTVENDPEDVAAINAVREAEVAAILSGDMSMDYMTGDVVVMPPDAPKAAGIQAARAWATMFTATVRVTDLTYTETKVTVSGDLAVERYAASITMVVGAGAPTTEAVKGIHVYRKGPEGWRMAMDVWNMDGATAGEM